MHGPLKYFRDHLGLNPGKKTSKGKKKRKAYNYRDYRGVDGAVEDTQRKK